MKKPSKKELKVKHYIKSLGVQATIETVEKDKAKLSVPSIRKTYNTLVKLGLSPHKVNEDRCYFKVPHGRIILRLSGKKMLLRTNH